MKITIITLGFPYPIQGILPGIERFTENIAIHLKNLGHEIKIVTTFLNGGKRNDSYKGIPILRVLDSKTLLRKFGSILIMNYYTFSLNLIRKKNFEFFKDSDVIIFTYVPIFSWFFKFKRISIISVFFHYDNPIYMKEHLTLPFIHHLEKRVFKKIKNVIAISNSSKNEIINRLGIKENYIKVIPVGVDLKKFNPSNATKEMNLKYGNKILMYSGSFEIRKRIPVLLKAMPKIVREIPDVHLILTGRGSQLKFCKELVQYLQLKKKISFLGFVPEEALLKYYASSVLYVLSSELEGFGQVMTEAMASGTPVVCANKAPMSEIIGNGGITFQLNDSRDLANKIIELLSNQEELRKLSSNALEVSKKYDWFHIARTYVDYIKKLRS